VDGRGLDGDLPRNPGFRLYKLANFLIRRRHHWLGGPGGRDWSDRSGKTGRPGVGLGIPDLETMIVALARKLLIALWRLATTGLVPDGVMLRPAV